MNNEIVTSLWAEKNVTGNSTSSYKGLIPEYYRVTQVPLNIAHVHTCVANFHRKRGKFSDQSDIFVWDKS